MTIKSGIIGIKTLKNKNNICMDSSGKRKTNKKTNLQNKDFKNEYPL
jgi:hypothetical protein